MLRRCAKWPGYDFHGQIDNCYIPKAKLEYWDLMRDLRNMKVSEANKFLFMEKDEFLQEKTVGRRCVFENCDR